MESAQEILETLHLSAAAPGQRADRLRPTPDHVEGADEDGTEGPLLHALGHDPVALDALIGRTGWPAAMLSARLLELELQGLVARLPGGLYQRQQGC